MCSALAASQSEHGHPTCCLQVSRGPSTACWRVLSLQLTSGRSSSWCAPIASSRGRWKGASAAQAEHQFRSLVLCVDLVGSRRIWPVQVGCLVDLVDPNGSSRIVRMIKPGHSRGRRTSRHKVQRLELFRSLSMGQDCGSPPARRLYELGYLLTGYGHSPIRHGGSRTRAW
jgi:hypothetical protein